MWSLAPCNEDGWRCDNCGAKLGWRPDLDRSSLEEKVDAIQFWMHTHELIYVSNGTEGDIVSANVAHRCRELDRYDQYTIIREIMTEPNIGSEQHGDFWAERARTYPNFALGAM